MKNVFYMLCLVLLLPLTIASCQSQPDSLAQNGAALSNLQEKLSVDPVFKTYREAFKDHVSFVISQRYVPQSFNKQVMEDGLKDIHSREEYLKLCEKAGIVDPQKQIESYYKLFVAQKALFTKYPEISKMSREDFKILMSKFDQEDTKVLFPTNRLSKSKN